MGFKWISLQCKLNHFAGLHLEGPFICKEKKGAHNPDFITTYDNGIQDVYDMYGSDLSNVAIVTIAPELERSTEVIEELVKKGIKVSIGKKRSLIFVFFML